MIKYNYISDTHGNVISAGYCDLGEGQKEATPNGTKLLLSIEVKYLKEVDGEIVKIENYEVEKQKAAIIGAIDTTTTAKLSEGYTDDGHNFRIGKDGAEYWTSAMKYFELSSAPYSVQTSTGETVEYSTIEEVNDIYKAGFELAMSIESKGGELIGRTKAAATQEELDQITVDNGAR
jgi:hypothetical protein